MVDVERAAAKRTRRGSQKGVVVGDRMNKTVVVEVARRVRHAIYKKYLERRVRYQAHDETEQYRVGDVVRIVGTRPLSRTKRFRVQCLLDRPD